MKKNLLFCAYDLNVGGIEKALVNLLNNIDYDKYNVHLLLERKTGVWLSAIPKQVTVEEYTPFSEGNILIRKFKNFLKLLKWKKINKGKYDFSCSFATYSRVCAVTALIASVNSHLWIHSDYTKIYDEKNIKKFFNGIGFKKFKRRIFVSEESMNNIMKFYKDKGNNYVVYNIIDYPAMLKDSREKINDIKTKRTTFINVSRHDDESKRLYRLFNACIKLKKDKYEFDVYLIGDGKDTSDYKKYVKKNKLDDVIHFLGRKSNPYPYYKKADASVVTSYYEGYPVVFLESLVFNVPIISTKVSDWKKLNGIYGIFVENDDDSIYYGMKKFLENGFEITEKYDYRKHNEEILEKLDYFITKKGIY